MRLAPSRTALAMLAALALSATSSMAAQVGNLTALVQDGQTFLTWTCPPGVGHVYRVYASGQALNTSADLFSARLVATVTDSTWYDARLSTLMGQVYGYRINAGMPPLGSDQGLFVITPTVEGVVYYAVTAQQDLFSAEDRTVTRGVNSLRKSVREYLRLPKPVYQRAVTVAGVTADVYTLWTTDTPTLYYPAMSNVPGMAFDCAVSHPSGGAPRALMVRPHPKGASFIECFQGTNVPGEYVLALDDPVSNVDRNTFWYGYHEGYNTQGDTNTPPTEGVVHDYTLQRVIHTVLWARNTFGVDTTQVYAYGYSMGAIGSVLLAVSRPDLIAGVLSIVGKFDFSFLDDPAPDSFFNPGHQLRELTDRLWGPVDVDLPTDDGRPTYAHLNYGVAAASLQPAAVPPILAFNGRYDTTVGWAEKIPFYEAMRAQHQGGYYFWDTRTHSNSTYCAWSPLQDPRYLYRFRTNLSFPALSNCSADGDPGDGVPTTGDSVGCINGFVEWDSILVDQATRWETTLHTRDLFQRWGLLTGPDSVLVDVTPRRLQHFRVVEGSSYAYSVTRLSDGAVVQSGVLTASTDNLLTLPAMKVYRGGSRIRIDEMGAAGVDPRTVTRLQLRLSRNPMGPRSSIELYWPSAGTARVELLDVSGRVVRVLHDGAVTAGFSRLALSTGPLPSGVYFVRALQGHEQAVQRAVVLN